MTDIVDDSDWEMSDEPEFTDEQLAEDILGKYYERAMLADENEPNTAIARAVDTTVSNFADDI